MIPVDLLFALGIGIWYIVVSVVVFKHMRKQTELQKMMLNEELAHTNALNGILTEFKELNSKIK